MSNSDHEIPKVLDIYLAKGSFLTSNIMFKCKEDTMYEPPFISHLLFDLVQQNCCKRLSDPAWAAKLRKAFLDISYTVAIVLSAEMPNIFLCQIWRLICIQVPMALGLPRRTIPILCRTDNTSDSVGCRFVFQMTYRSSM